jgi:tRNA (guanine37-N1)-methyltransferase
MALETVTCIKVPLKDAEVVKHFLIDSDIIDRNFRFRKDSVGISFPVVSSLAAAKVKKKFPSVAIIDVKKNDLEKSSKKGTLKDAVSGDLSKSELECLRRAYDVVGSIAILEIPPELESKQDILADTILRMHKNIRTVLKKSGAHGGEFRTRPLSFLAGVDTKETVHVESSVRLKLDVEKVYYSVRMGTERLRIAKLVKQGESVLAMFSGCGPYPLVLAKKSKAKHITGIELNPVGHRYALENLKLNKVKNVDFLEGDVLDVVKRLHMKFDRIVMPLPKSAEDFLDAALSVSKRGTVVHFYDFLREDEFDKAIGKIDSACKRNSVSYRVLRTVKCGQHAPRTFRICVDFVLV